MSENKIRKPFWLSQESHDKIDINMQVDGSRSRSEFLEKAIDYYSVFLNTENNKDIVSQIFVTVVESKLEQTENRLSKLLFKLAVEQAKLSNVVAYNLEIDDEILEKLHFKCVEEVKKTNGKFKFEDAFKYQRDR